MTEPTVQSSTPVSPDVNAGAAPAAGTVASPDSVPAADAVTVKWRSLQNVETDPVYATLLKIRLQADGSSLLTVDPVSPDTTGVIESDCYAYEWTTPAGTFCPVNVAAKGRKVSLLPDAETTFLGSPISREQLASYVATYFDYNRDPLLRLTLDAARHVVAIDVVAPGADRQSAEYEPEPTDTSTEDWVDPNYEAPTDEGTTTRPLVTVPNFVGAGNKAAEQEAFRRGLRLWVVGYTTADPSVAAVSRGQCRVAQQGIPFGQVVEKGTQVRITLACPQTGYDPGGSMGYTGPAPPPAWTGR